MQHHSHPFTGVFMPSPFATPFESPPPALLGVRALGTHAAAAAAEDLLLSFSAEAFTTALSASCVRVKSKSATVTPCSEKYSKKGGTKNSERFFCLLCMYNMQDKLNERKRKVKIKR